MVTKEDISLGRSVLPAEGPVHLQPVLLKACALPVMWVILNVLAWHHGVASSGPTSGWLSDPSADLSWLSRPGLCLLAPSHHR